MDVSFPWVIAEAWYERMPCIRGFVAGDFPSRYELSEIHQKRERFAFCSRYIH